MKDQCPACERAFRDIADFPAVLIGDVQRKTPDEETRSDVLRRSLGDQQRAAFELEAINEALQTKAVEECLLGLEEHRGAIVARDTIVTVATGRDSYRSIGIPGLGMKVQTDHLSGQSPDDVSEGRAMVGIWRLHPENATLLFVAATFNYEGYVKATVPTNHNPRRNLSAQF